MRRETKKRKVTSITILQRTVLKIKMVEVQTDRKMAEVQPNETIVVGQPEEMVEIEITVDLQRETMEIVSKVREKIMATVQEVL